MDEGLRHRDGRRPILHLRQGNRSSSEDGAGEAAEDRQPTLKKTRTINPATRSRNASSQERKSVR